MPVQSVKFPTLIDYLKWIVFAVDHMLRPVAVSYSPVEMELHQFVRAFWKSSARHGLLRSARFHRQLNCITISALYCDMI